jgi:hypothetical protein
VTSGAFAVTQGTATQIAVNVGNNQSVTVGSAVPVPPSVIVRDANNNPVGGVSVTFAVASGGGTVVPTTPVTTGANGVAAVTSWTLGTTAGTNTLTATAAGLAGSPVTFTATGTVGTATQIAVNAGNNQTATAGTAVATPPSVIVKDANNNPVAGVLVTFAVASGGGSVVPTTAVTTGSNGIAAVTSWTLGPAAGTNTLTATAPGLAGSPVTFTATGTVGTATQIAINAGNNQSATVGTAVATPPSVIVKDANNNPVAGVSVTFAVASGGGTVVPTTAVATGANGVAAVTSWTLGTTAGVNTLTATATGLTGSPVTFTATGTASTATQIAINAGNNQSATAGAAVAIPPSVIVKDASNNPVAGVSVTFAVASGGGTVVPTTAITTNASGIAQVTSWTLGTTAGTNTLTATSAGLTGSPVTFTATGTVGAATQIAINGGNNQSATVGTAVATPPSVIVRDVNNNPVSGVNVTFAVASGGGTVVPTTAIATNASGIAQVTSWTLGAVAGTNTLTATSAGLAGSPVTFTATGTAGVATQLVFTQQPPNPLAAGNTFVVVVTARDAQGNTVTSFAGPDTIAIGTNPASGTLSGTTVVTPVLGVATFSGLSIDKVGTGYTLIAKSTLSVTSSAFNVITGGVVSATQTTVTAVPATITASMGISTSTVTVTAKDAQGNVVAGVLVTPSATGSLNTFAPSAGSTDANGVFTTLYSSLGVGAHTVSAQVQSVTPTQQPVVTVNPALTTTLAVASKALTVNTAYTPFTPVTASGGTTPYTFAISPALPAGMSLSTTTGQISGTPTATLAQTAFKVKVTDAAAAADSQTFQLTVNGALVVTQAVASKTLTVNTAYTPFTPVTASGGTTPYTFAVSPALPAGMSLSTTTGQISGTPTATLALTTFTVTVTDAATATGSATFQLTVNGALVVTQAVASKALTVNTAYTPFTPVTATGGTTPYVFGISPALPAGMSLSATTGQISGTPTATLALTTFTVTVTDAATATGSATFQLTVNGALVVTQAVASKVLTVNTAYTPFTPVTASGGTAPYTFGISPALPAGMSLSTTTGQISGTPTATLATTTFTVTVTDAAAATGSATFQLAVNGALVVTQSVASKSLTVNTAYTPFTPVTASGGTAPYTFGVSPALPAGMSLSTTTGEVSGTPTATLATTTFTVTVTDAATATGSATFQLTVNGALVVTQAVASKVLTVNTPYTPFTPVTVTGGTTPYTFGISPALPAGMSLSTTTGQISGTPTATLAQTTFTVTVTDAASATGSATFQLTVNGALVVTQAVASKSLTVNTAYTPFTPVTASGGTTPYTFALSGGTLPSGMSFSTTSGQISGTPTATLATTTFTVSVTDAATATGSATFQLTVNGALVVTQAIASKALTVNTSYTPFTPVTASGGTTPYTFGISPALPAGMSLSTTTGQISGTPTATLATTTFTVTVTDAASATGSATFQLTVNSALTTTQAVPTTVLTVNTPYTPFTPVTASGGTTPYTFGVSPALPAGMSLSTTTGQISGTPTATLATTTFTVTVTDAASATSSKTFSLTVNGPLTVTQAVSSKSLTVNTAYTPFTPVTASGGTTPYTFALSGGTLPAGMSFSTTSGQISGTPTATLGTTTFTVTVTDAASATGSATFQLTVNGALVVTQAIASKSLTVNTAYTPFTPVTASGGTVPYTFALSGGTLPAGMSFSTTTGQISGTPTATLGTTTFTVTVTDGASATGSATFQLTVNGALVVTQAVANKSLTVNTGYTPFTPVTASGGTTPYTFALSGGTLPAGMSFSTTTGQISGTPTATLGTTTFTVTVTDGASATGSATFQLTVNSALTTTQAVPTTVLTVNTPYTPFTPVTASGGTTPYTFALSGGTPPAGMSFSTTTGQISGTPTATLAQTTFTVTVTDGASATSSKTFSLTVNGALTVTQAVASKSLTVNTAYTPFTPVTASGGTTPYTFALSGGTLPTGMSFSTTSGTISGTPTATLGTTTFTVTVTDAATATGSATFQLTVNGALVVTQAVASKSLTVNTAYTPFTPVTASGGTTPYTFALSGGTLPAGMSFSTTSGQISGTPTATLATTTFTVTVTDAASATGSASFQLTVNSALTTTQAVPTTVLDVGQTYTPFVPVTASGGTTPYAFALSGGTLPSGMSFSTTTGTISGTATATLAQTTFTVTVTDAASATSSKTFQLTVNSALTTTQAVPTTVLDVGQAYTPFVPVTASGGTTPYAFALSGGTLPSGMSFSTTTGTISGTATATLTLTTFTVTVTDAAGATSSKTFELTVNSALTTTQAVPSTTLTIDVAATPFTPVTASGGTTPYTFALTQGTLPAGLSFNTATGEISGTPTATLTLTTFTVTVTDAAGATSSATFDLTVN